MSYTIPESGLRLPTGHRIHFAHQQRVFLVTDRQQSERMVVGISLRLTGAVTYCLALGASESWHYKEEISATKDQVLAVT